MSTSFEYYPGQGSFSKKMRNNKNYGEDKTDTSKKIRESCDLGES